MLSWWESLDLVAVEEEKNHDLQKNENKELAHLRHQKQYDQCRTGGKGGCIFQD